MDLHLRDKVIVITGGSDGLGAALARDLVGQGARVAICGRSPERIERARSMIDDDTRLLAMSADVTDAEQMAAFVAAVTARWQQIDGLVNNAGVAAAGRVADVTDEAWLGDFDLKVVAAARLIRLCLPHMHGGSIVNVLSVGARIAPASSMPTNASRAAGLALTKAASKELGAVGIRVNAILIGLIKSNQWERRAEQSARPVQEIYEELAQRSAIPLGRVGEPQEFADLASYLLSDRSSYVTGSALNLDGGSSAAI